MARKVTQVAKTGRRLTADYDGTTPLPDPKQELFCTIFTTNTLPNFWGHGQHSYSFAYGHDQRVEEIQDQIDKLVNLTAKPKKERKGKAIAQIEREINNLQNNIISINRSCRAAAPRLLATVSIKARCGHLLDQLAIHQIVDRELVYLIQQREDNHAKMAAIQHHDRREQRIREKLDIKHEVEPIAGFIYVKPTGTKK